MGRSRPGQPALSAAVGRLCSRAGSTGRNSETRATEGGGTPQWRSRSQAQLCSIPGRASWRVAAKTGSAEASLWADEYLGLTQCCARPGSVARGRCTHVIQTEGNEGNEEFKQRFALSRAMIEPASIFFRLPSVTFVSSCSNLPAAAADESPKVPVTFRSATCKVYRRLRHRDRADSERGLAGSEASSDRRRETGRGCTRRDTPRKAVTARSMRSSARMRGQSPVACRVEALDQVEVRLGLADQPPDVDLGWVFRQAHSPAATAPDSTTPMSVNV